MADTALKKKLLLKTQPVVAVFNAPAGFAERIEPLDGGRLLSEPGEQAEFVLLFAKDKAELHGWLEPALTSVQAGGLFWIAYPKGTSKVKSDLNRDILWEIMQPKGFEGIAMVAIDDTWSAMRFRPALGMVRPGRRERQG
jgi:hypothetical protein